MAKERRDDLTGKNTSSNGQTTRSTPIEPTDPENDISRGPQQDHQGERTFNILVDSVPYVVKSIPFTFNDEIRYRVSFNGSPEHVFTWDSSMGQLRAIDDDSSTMPDNLEIAISEKLQSKG